MIGVRLETNAPYVRNKLGQIQTHIPKVSSAETKAIAELFIPNLKKAAPKWNHYLEDSIKVVEIEKGWGVEMFHYGVLLDGGDSGMRSHFVPTGFGSDKEPFPPFKEWVEAHANTLARNGKLPKAVKVSPKPWINNGIQKPAEVLRNHFATGGKSEFRRYLKSLGDKK